MPCKSCGSTNQSKFIAEMGIHFPGAKNKHPYRYTSRYPYTGCSFLEGFELTLKTYSEKGAPFYNV